MRLSLVASLAVLSVSPASLFADATIRYKNEMTSAAPVPSSLNNAMTVIYMKGNKGVTVAGGSSTIADFAKQEVTMIDHARKKYATIPVSEYGTRLEAIVPDNASATGAAGAMLKSMKTTCESKKPGVTEVIQGVQTEERDVTCSMTMSMPDGAPQAAMSMKFVMKVWSALPVERMRVPALWELSGYELWQKYFMNPIGASGKMSPEGMAPLVEAMSKDQSVALRTSMDMFMEMPSSGATGGASSTPFMKMSNEVVELSVAPLDDSLFAIPADYTSVSFGEVMNGLTQAMMESAKVPAAGDGSGASIPADIKAYIPSLTPLTRTGPAVKDVQGTVEVLITVGRKGNVEGVEALGGPQELQKAAIDTASQWTFRPVMRDGAAVSAYTTATVFFIDRSKGPLGASSFMPDMAGEQRKERLAEAMPRSPQQIFADLEQDAGGGDKTRRYDLLGPLAKAALKAGLNEKAGALAAESLAAAEQNKKGWNYGNAVHDGHTMLGLVALRSDDVTTARQQLLEAGKTPGSPQLNSFGPNMALASELLKRGESSVVLDYFEECRAFWKMGGKQLDSWSNAVRRGETPFFGANLR